MQQGTVIAREFVEIKLINNVVMVVVKALGELIHEDTDLGSPCQVLYERR
jgi:hypothetical protein